MVRTRLQIVRVQGVIDISLRIFIRLFNSRSAERKHFPRYAGRLRPQRRHSERMNCTPPTARSCARSPSQHRPRCWRWGRQQSGMHVASHRANEAQSRFHWAGLHQPAALQLNPRGGGGGVGRPACAGLAELPNWRRNIHARLHAEQDAEDRQLSGSAASMFCNRKSSGLPGPGDSTQKDRILAVTSAGGTCGPR